MLSPDPILITGCARSGTSLTAGIISACGANGGKVCGATSANKKGQFENVQLRNSLVKPYLRLHGYDPLGQKPLPNIHKLLPVDNFRKQTFTILRKQGYDGKEIWYWKGAKLCLIWPTIEKAFPQAKWIIVRRKDEEIVNSCMKTHFMRKRKTPEEWQEWVDVHKRRFDEMNMALGDRVKETWPSDLFKGNFDSMKEIVNWCGLEWDQEKIDDFLDVRLWSPLAKKGT